MQKYSAQTSTFLPRSPQQLPVLVGESLFKDGETPIRGIESNALLMVLVAFGPSARIPRAPSSKMGVFFSLHLVLTLDAIFEAKELSRIAKFFGISVRLIRAPSLFGALLRMRGVLWPVSYGEAQPH
jgi:hypothetical protein